MPASSLPDDIAALKRMLASRDETIAQLVAEMHVLNAGSTVVHRSV
jgi:hypothetical protein